MKRAYPGEEEEPSFSPTDIRHNKINGMIGTWILGKWREAGRNTEATTVSGCLREECMSVQKQIFDEPSS